MRSMLVCCLGRGGRPPPRASGYVGPAGQCCVLPSALALQSAAGQGAPGAAAQRGRSRAASGARGGRAFDVVTRLQRGPWERHEPVEPPRENGESCLRVVRMRRHILSRARCATPDSACTLVYARLLKVRSPGRRRIAALGSADRRTSRLYTYGGFVTRDDKFPRPTAALLRSLHLAGVHTRRPPQKEPLHHDAMLERILVI